MATNCSRCFHALQKFKARQIQSIVRTALYPFQVLQINNYSSESKVLPDVLNSRANEFSGEKSKLFESEEVQSLLRALTGLDVNIVFKARKETLQNPVYKVLDKEELKKEEENALEEARNRLEMPPVMKQRKPINVTLSEDAGLINHDEDSADYVFTDISMSQNSRTRAIIVRENSTGKLREATWDERDRMQYIYWPKEGQYHELVPMLQDEHLPHVFDDLRHEDVLDFINVQCEADSPDYIRVHKRVYDDLEERQQYGVLYSTRHYGGMVFYYITNGKTNNFLSYLLRNGRIEDSVHLINLFAIIYPDSTIAANIKGVDDIDVVKKYLFEEGMQHLLEFLEPAEYVESKE